MSYVDEALAKAEKAISIQRSFGAFFLKAYVLADKNLYPDESYTKDRTNVKNLVKEEMTELIEKAFSKAAAYEKRSEYCEREKSKEDLDLATSLDPLGTYPYRYRAAG
ncbi:hypothetical protein HA466_0205980 [Hirschfeldia incana]|nr:hypothetical protein HA466_0205980 [Hirschfeldia incana]